MDINLTGKIAVVTGASKGIGLAISQVLAEAGAHIVAGARHNTPEMRALEDAGAATFVAGDLAAPQGVDALVAAAAERGGIDILVPNAGAVHPHLGGFLTITDEDWAASVQLNLMSTVRTVRAAVPQMLIRGGGSIVVISSVNAELPDPNIADYSATKAAVTNLAKGLSKEFGPKGIRVNTISPGPVATELWLSENGVAAALAEASGSTPDQIVASVAAGTATGRFTTAREVADLTLFLAGDLAANITGSDIRIDGGYVTTV